MQPKKTSVLQQIIFMKMFVKKSIQKEKMKAISIVKSRFANNYDE